MVDLSEAGDRLAQRSFAAPPPFAHIARRARRRRRRRGAAAAFTAALVLAVVTALITLTVSALSGPRPQTVTAGPGPVTAPLARWTPVSTPSSTLPTGVSLSSVVSYQGRLVAAGLDTTPCSPAPTAGCDVATSTPTIWTSTPGRPWVKSWANDRPVAEGTGVSVITTPNGLWVFAGDHLWRSNNTATFAPIPLPSAMGPVTTATWGHGLIVAVSTTGPVSTIWTSPNGQTWQSHHPDRNPDLYTLVTTPTGFLAGGEIGTNGPAAIWASSNGRTWTATTLGTQQGAITYTATANGRAVAIDTSPQPATTQLWWSTDGKHWNNPTPFASEDCALGLAAGNDVFLLETTTATTNTGCGQIDLNITRIQLWYSPDGAAWTDLTNTGQPHSSDTEQLSHLYTNNPQPVAALVNSTARLSLWTITPSA